jgi:hypothetical protein
MLDKSFDEIKKGVDNYNLFKTRDNKLHETS